MVGAQQKDGAAGPNQGSAYVFARSGAVWNQQQKLEAPDAAASDLFGQSVAISGDTIVVGAPLDDGAGAVDQGSAYVFALSGGFWSHQQKLAAPDPAVNDEFGSKVAINGDTIVVGAPLDDGAGGDSQGSAYVFTRSGGFWSHQQKLEAPDADEGGEFGLSVAISGATLVVGSRNDGAAGVNQGSAYVFARIGEVWSQQQKLEASDAEAGDQFGFSVGISGGTIVVGSTFGNSPSSAYVFVQPPPNTSPAITVASVSRTQGLPASIG